MMLIIIDCEGSDLVQEFSALYVNEETHVIEDVFHHYIQYPIINGDDKDAFVRRHVHGLDCEFLLQHGLRDEEELLTLFHTWLKHHPYDAIYAHAPAKEMDFLSLSVKDVMLKPWKDRIFTDSHKIALHMKLNCVSVNGILCRAHSAFQGWKPKKSKCLSETDCAKIAFRHHCSLYDCMECFLSIILRE